MNQPEPVEPTSEATVSAAETSADVDEVVEASPSDISTTAQPGQERPPTTAVRPNSTQQILTLIVLILIVVSLGLIVYGAATDDPAAPKRPRSSAAVTSTN